MNVKDMTDAELIQAEFARRFSMWEIPVEDMATYLSKLPNEERQGHYLKIQEIMNNASFQLEINDWLRRLSRTLAMGMHNGTPLTEDQKNGLRQTMLEVESFPKILAKRVLNITQPKSLKPMHKNM